MLRKNALWILVVGNCCQPELWLVQKPIVVKLSHSFAQSVGS